MGSSFWCMISLFQLIWKCTMNYCIAKKKLRVSEHTFMLFFKIFGDISWNVPAFLELRCSISFSISSKEVSLNKKGVAPLLMLIFFINKMLGWFTFWQMVFSTVSIYSLVSFLMYEFSFISRFFVAFWKKKFIYSEIRLSSEISLSSLPTSGTFGYLSFLRK